jgi:uncharacterized protein (DUF58 family)
MRPSAALVAVLIAWALVGAGVVAALLPMQVFVVCGIALVLIAAQDLLLLRALPTPDVHRDLPAVMPVAVERAMLLRLRHGGKRPLRVQVQDLHPGDWPVFGLPREVSLPPGRELELPYRLTPIERGQFLFETCALRLRSPFALWWQLRHAGTAQSLRVYPNFAPLAKLALIGSEQASRVVGAHLKRRRGEGTEFQQLREYRTGDSMRQIDWKASQRARKLISRDYQDERNQQVMLLLDTGRRLLARDGSLAHFDHVLNAALMVAYMALRQGDAVGLLAAGGTSRYLSPGRGLGTIDSLLNTVFDLKAQPVATDYLDAAMQLASRQSRRSLVLLITNVRDEDIEDLVVAVRLMQKRHLVCVASLREQVVDTALQQDVQGFDDAIRVAAMAQYVEQRTRAHQALRAQGSEVLDVTCAELPAALVEHYLAIKRAGRL